MTNLNFRLASAAFLLALSSTATVAQDWSGFYVGIGGSTVDTSTTFDGLPFEYQGEDNVAPTIYGGYNYQLPSMIVVGAEVMYTAFDNTANTLVPFGAEDLTQFRGRVGYALGDVMPFAAVGYTMSTATLFGAPSSVFEDTSGFSVAVGLDYQLNEQFSIRAEYSGSFLEIDSPGAFPPGTETNIEMFTIGGAFHF